MSLPHILLGMLREPQSGYDLKKEFSGSLQHFWHAELSQIYPTLKRLERDGLVSAREAAARAGPPRKIYRRTAKGRRELLDWLGQGPVTGTERIAYLAQIYFLAEQEDDPAALRYFRSLREHMRGWLDIIRGVDAEWRASDPRYPDALPPRDFYAQLTLAAGLRKVSANVEWCDECIERIEARMEHGPG